MAVVLLALAATGALAWAAVSLIAHGAASGASTAGPVMPTVVWDDPTCTKVGTGTITNCAKKAGDQGVDMAITGISNNAAGGQATIVTALQHVRNTSAFKACLTVSMPVTPGLVIVLQDGGPMCLSAGGDGNVKIDYDFGSIVANQTPSAVITYEWKETP
jgi:hypothetical protein